MEKYHIRRVPVVDEEGRCAGIIAQADVARGATTDDVAEPDPRGLARDQMKRVLSAALALLVALIIGWLWGVSGRSAAERASRDSQLRSELLDGRMAVLDARLDLYSVNFGTASQHLETAKSLLKQARDRISSAGAQDDAKHIDQALAQIDEAQRLAARLDQAANTKAATAAQTIDEVLKATPRR